MISFFAYHGDAQLRKVVIGRIAGLVKDGRRSIGVDRDGGRTSFFQAFTGDVDDLAAAHRESGFTVTLLQVGSGIYECLSDEEATDFALALAKAARIDADLANVALEFMTWMFEAAVAELVPDRIRSTAAEAGDVFKHLADSHRLTAAQHQAAKVMAKRARRRGVALPSVEDLLVKDAVNASLDHAGQHAGCAIRWIAGLADQPDNKCRRFAHKLLELVETA